MQKLTIKSAIIKYLERYPGWQSGGTIGEAIGDFLGMKSSNIERRCRELCGEGRIERNIMPSPSGKKVVHYQIEEVANAPVKPKEPPKVIKQGSMGFLSKLFED